MLNTLKQINQFYSWWIYSLLSCLPEEWYSFFSGAKSNFDLVIVHQEDSIIIMTNQGKILDSIPLSGKDGIDLKNLPAEESVVGKFSNTQLSDAEKLYPDLDPSISPVSETLDFDLTDQKQEINVESLDLVLGNATQSKRAHEYTPGSFDHAKEDNVISLNLQRDDDATVWLDDEDQTLGFLESKSDEDTLIIKNDQGNLLQFDSMSAGDKEGTILFRNDGGKIRQVNPDDLESQELDKLDGQLENMLHGGDPADYIAVVKLLEIYQRNKKCIYLLPDSKTFILNLSYPIEAIQNIESVLKYDLEKHIPLSEQEVRYFYALDVDAGRGKVNAEVVVIKSEEYDLLNLTLEPFLKTGLLCTTEIFFRKYGNKINFLEQKSEKNWQSNFKLRNLHLAFNWMLFIVLLTLPYWTFYQGIEAIEEKPPAEVSRVKDLVSAFNSTSAESNFGSILSEQVNKTPKSIEMLSILSSSINSQAWLHRFSFNNNEIKIKGEADSATSVSDDLNKTGLFESIKFVSSIVKNSRSGKESFELLLILKSDA